jgi:hypothetical protein
MNITPVLFTVLVVLLAPGLVAWARFAGARVEEDLRSIGGFEGIHFEI